jgi:hypothetical protein
MYKKTAGWEYNIGQHRNCSNTVDFLSNIWCSSHKLRNSYLYLYILPMYHLRETVDNKLPPKEWTHRKDRGKRRELYQGGV